MVVRVDTTNLTRGFDFSISIFTNANPTVSLYAFNSATHLVELLDCTMTQEGVFFKANAKAPYFDGFLLAKINSKSMVVKKIGHPTPHFVIGYKDNFTVAYKQFNEAGIIIKSDNLLNIIDGFYYCEIGSNVTIMETLKKRFIMKDNLTKLDYEVDLSTSILQDVTLPNYLLETTLSDATLPNVVLENIDLGVTLTDVNIRG